MIEVNHLSYQTGGKEILHDISCRFDDGLITGLLGANGSGKSTLLRHICRSLPSHGTVTIDGCRLEGFSVRELACHVAVMSQESMQAPIDFAVRDLVVMGRYAHKCFGQGYGAKDWKCVDKALQQTGLDGMGTRSFATLSGGEKQRALLARAICQDAPVLILDEPTNHLDLFHQLALMELLTKLGKTVLIALHDLNIAAMYCQKLVVLQNGRLAITGIPERVLTSANIERLFGLNVEVEKADGAPWIRIMRQLR